MFKRGCGVLGGRCGFWDGWLPFIGLMSLVSNKNNNNGMGGGGRLP